jgi:antitoxin component of RelBE/YafQ-DinJ toxin-antitoxin module
MTDDQINSRIEEIKQQDESARRTLRKLQLVTAVVNGGSMPFDLPKLTDEQYRARAIRDLKRLEIATYNAKVEEDRRLKKERKKTP